MCLFGFLLHPQHLDHLPGAERAHTKYILSELIILTSCRGKKSLPQGAENLIEKTSHILRRVNDIRNMHSANCGTSCGFCPRKGEGRARPIRKGVKEEAGTMQSLE